MYASVEVHAASETMLLPARNISLGGVYLTSDGHDLSMLELGMELEVVVFDALNERRKPVRLVGEIVRHDGDGLALMWADSDPDVALALAKLLDRLQPKESEKSEKKPTSDETI
jgi:hypothetical protein